MDRRRFKPDWGRIGTLIVAAAALVAAGVTIWFRNGALGGGTPAACATIVTHAALSLPPWTVVGCTVAFAAGYLWRRLPYAEGGEPDA